MIAQFLFLPEPGKCPAASNCYCFSEAFTGECTLEHEREAGANACDFVQWIEKPASTFDAVEVVAEGFKVDARTLEEVTQ